MRTILVTVGTSLLSNLKRTTTGADPNREALAEFLRTQPAAKASAETNSLSRLMQPDDDIILLHSETEEGIRCSDALARHLNREGYRTAVKEIKDLQYRESRFKMRGLRSLVDTLATLIRDERRKGREVLINATGGFKV